MTAKRLVIWRHGQTDWNVDGRYQGQLDIGLNETGRQQAELAAPYLAELHPAQLWSSPLSRARDTAEALARIVELDVRTDARLKEVDVGEWEGLTTAEVYGLDPAFADAMQSGRDARRSTGETATEVGRRVAAALDDIGMAAPDGSTVVVASHGLATRMGVATLIGLDYAHSLSLAGLRNCAWSIVEPARLTRWRLLMFNATAPGPRREAKMSDDDAW